MPRTMTEFFSGGVVTSRIGALLEPGELQRADDCIYREKDPALWRAPGRTALNSTALGSPSPIKGLSHASFERTRVDQLISYVGTALYRSPITATAGVLDSLAFTELGGPALVAGTVSASTTFTATTGYPFLADVVGANVYGASVPAGTYVTAVSGQDGSTGHYNIVTLSATSTGATSITFDFGCTFALENQGDEILDTIQYGNAYFAWFGRAPMRTLTWRDRRAIGGAALSPTMVSRPAGLDAVRTAPTITEVSNADYLWNSALAVGYYWFLITEAFAPGGDLLAAEKDVNLRSEIVEGAYLASQPTASDATGSVGRPIPVLLTALTGKAIQIVLPAVTNTGTTGRLANNWVIYMYGPTLDNLATPSLAQFRRVRIAAITQFTAGQTVILTESALAPQLKYAGSNAAVAAQSPRPEFTTAANMLGAPNFTYGISKSGTNNDDPPYAVNAIDFLSTYAFDTSGSYATATVVGVEVQITGKASVGYGNTDKAGFIAVVQAAGVNFQAVFNAFGAYGTIYIGGPTYNLGMALANLGTIGVQIEKSGSGAKQTLMIDAVGIKVYFNGATINLNGPAYRVVTYRDQVGFTVSDPVNIPPPDCSTGDFFQGMLVLNDLSDETALRYSLPGKPEAFPKPYVMYLNSSKRHDRVTYIRSIGQVLVVGLENSIERINYLPREVNTDLTDGLAHEAIASDHGIPGPLCATTVDIPGKGIVLAYVSAAGMFITNGIWTTPINLDLDWSATVKLTALSGAVLRVYPKEKLLALYYCPAGATHSRNTRVMYFCYQADKLKGPYGLPAIGPSVVSARSACEAFISGRSYLLTGQETDGKVYWEDNGVTIPSGYQVTLTATSSTQGDGKAGSGVDVKISPFVRTRKFYPVNVDRDGYGEKIYLMFSQYGVNTVTASSVLTVGSTTITSSAAFGVVGTGVMPGMRVLGTGMDPGVIVLSKSDSSTIVVSRAPNTSGTVTLTFDTGTLGITVRGSALGENPRGLRTDYCSTLIGELVSVVNSNMRRGFELQVEKVPLTFDSNGDTLTWADLGTNMRLHTISYVLLEGGSPDANRNAN